MSAISHDFALRSLAVAGILAAAALGTPGASHAQAGHPDRALLNRVALNSVAPAPDVAPSQPVLPVHTRTGAVNGERALLTRTAHDSDLDPAETRTPTATPAAPVDGARALRGQWSEGGRP